MENENTKEKKKLKAKTISKIFKFVSVIGLITTFIVKWLGVFNAEAGEICLAWITVYGVGAGTIDLNIVIDKFINKNVGGVQ